MFERRLYNFDQMQFLAVRFIPEFPNTKTEHADVQQGTHPHQDLGSKRDLSATRTHLTLLRSDQDAAPHNRNVRADAPEI